MTRRDLTRLVDGILLGLALFLITTGVFASWHAGLATGAATAVLTWTGLINIGDTP